MIIACKAFSPRLVYRGKYIKAAFLYTILQSISIITHCKISPATIGKCDIGPLDTFVLYTSS